MSAVAHRVIQLLGFSTPFQEEQIFPSKGCSSCAWWPREPLDGFGIGLNNVMICVNARTDDIACHGKAGAGGGRRAEGSFCDTAIVPIQDMSDGNCGTWEARAAAQCLRRNHSQPSNH
jgi:hypothetical protein